MNKQTNDLAAMLMRVECAMLCVSNESYDTRYGKAIHHVYELIYELLHQMEVGNGEARLERNVSLEFLAHFIRSDELDPLRWHFEDRAAEIEKWKKEQGLE